MKIYACEKCGSTDVFMQNRGHQKALMCGDCGKWIKWIGNKELPLVKRYIDSQKKDNSLSNENEFTTMEIKLKVKDIPKVIEFLNSL